MERVENMKTTNSLAISSLALEIQEKEKYLDKMLEEAKALKKKRAEFMDTPEYQRLWNALLNCIPAGGSRFTKNPARDAALQAYAAWEKASGLSETVKRDNELNKEIKMLWRELQELKEKKLELEREEYRKELTPERIAKYVKKAVNRFGITARFDLAGYVTVGGALLDFSEGQCRRVLDHREVAEVLDFLPDECEKKDGMMEFMNMGNIRLQPFGIDIAKAPTPKQEAVLRRFFEYLHGEVRVDFSKKDGRIAGSIDFPVGTSANFILQNINRYFKTGIVPELSLVARFHAG